jgi:hypothetical protein
MRNPTAGKKPSPHRDISAILADTKFIEAVLCRAVRKALVRHKQAGLPVVEWRNGKTVWIPPEKLDRVIRAIDAKLEPKRPSGGAPRRPK